MRKIKKTMTLLSVISLLFLGNIFLSCSNSDKKDVVDVACNLPLTGNLATYGESVKDGVTFAIENIKKNNPNKELNINFDWQDNTGEAKNAVTIMKKQYLKDIDIYISGVKPQTMSIIDEISKQKTPHFVWIFDAFVCQKYPNTFRTWVSYKYEPEYYLDYAKKTKPKKVAIIYVNLPHSEEEFTKLVIPQLNEIGITDIFSEKYEIDKMDYKDIAAKVSAFKPDLIILNGFKNTIIGLVLAFGSYNLIIDGNTIVTYDMLDAAEELPIEATEGIKCIAPIFNTCASDTTLNSWKNNFEKRFKRKPRYTDAYAYDMAFIIYEASKSIKDHTPDNWANAIKSVNIKGITGDLIFDKDGDLKIQLEIGVYRNGVLIPDTNSIAKNK